MKKINRFLIIYMIVITVLCAYMCYLAFTRNENIDKIQEVRSQVTTTVLKEQTKEVFEYTDMKKENLPADILNMLKENFVFENREEVYHFLESYSS